MLKLESCECFINSYTAGKIDNTDASEISSAYVQNSCWMPVMSLQSLIQHRETFLKGYLLLNTNWFIQLTLFCFELLSNFLRILSVRTKDTFLMSIPCF